MTLFIANTGKFLIYYSEKKPLKKNLSDFQREMETVKTPTQQHVKRAAFLPTALINVNFKLL